MSTLSPMSNKNIDPATVVSFGDEWRRYHQDSLDSHEAYLRFNEYFSEFPFSYYRNYFYYSMRTDARDRLGTPLEKRFSKKQIIHMCKSAGLENIKFSNSAPFWCLSFTKSSN